MSETKIQTEPPLPAIGIGEILGLVEVLKSKGGKEDIYKLAAELKMEFGDMITVIRGAELLGLVNTPGGDVVIENLGIEVSKSKVNARKLIIRDQLLKINVFSQLSTFLRERDDHQATRDQLLEKLAELVPNEDNERTLSTVVAWGRYAELFGYNDDSGTFYLDNGT